MEDDETVIHLLSEVFIDHWNLHPEEERRRKKMLLRYDLTLKKQTIIMSSSSVDIYLNKNMGFEGVV